MGYESFEHFQKQIVKQLVVTLLEMWAELGQERCPNMTYEAQYPPLLRINITSLTARDWWFTRSIVNPTPLPGKADGDFDLQNIMWHKLLKGHCKKLRCWSEWAYLGAKQCFLGIYLMVRILLLVHRLRLWAHLWFRCYIICSWLINWLIEIVCRHA